MTSWPAPRAHAPLHASVELPGSKSLTNRHLILAALSRGPSRIIAPLRARDTLLMADALRALGTGITDAEPAEPRATGSAPAAADWLITPGPLHGADIEAGLAGTVMRFVPAVAALATGSSRFDGDEYARTRPMRALLEGLRAAGVSVDDHGTGTMPFTITGHGAVPGGTVDIDASASSQFVSALLLAGARFTGGIEVRHTGASLPSVPHIEMTVDVLRAAGVQVRQPTPTSWRVLPGPVTAADVLVEPDLSNAGPFLAAAVVTGGQVHIPHWPAKTTQPGDALRALLITMGAHIALDGTGLRVTGTGRIAPLVADLRDVTELVPTLAAIAALAQGESRFTGIAHMRGHETDRLAALRTEINRLGGDATDTADGLVIRPAPLHGGLWRAYADHRMATAGAILGLVTDGVQVDDIGCTSKTLPDFPGLWASMWPGAADGSTRESS